METTELEPQTKAPGADTSKTLISKGKEGPKGEERYRALLPLTRKLSALAADAVQTALREQAQNVKRRERARGICEVAFNGVFMTALKNSPLLSSDDKEFAKDFFCV